MGKKVSAKKAPSLGIISEKEIALDFATKVYKKFDKLIKSVVLFGSQAKNTQTPGSDIDLIIIVDDTSIKWDPELITWYREELGKVIRSNPYQKELHINSVRLSTWWQDVLRGDPVVINVIRFGEAILDFGGFFTPLKILLEQGKIKATPEAIYTALQRAPIHLARSRSSKLNSIEGLYWAAVDSAQAALMAAKQVPPSPEHIPDLLTKIFVETGNLKSSYVDFFRNIFTAHKRISHGAVTDIHGEEINKFEKQAEDFVQEMTKVIKKIIS